MHEAKWKLLAKEWQKRFLNFFGQEQFLLALRAFDLALLRLEPQERVDNQAAKTFEDFLILFVKVFAILRVQCLHDAKTLCSVEKRNRNHRSGDKPDLLINRFIMPRILLSIPNIQRLFGLK